MTLRQSQEDLEKMLENVSPRRRARAHVMRNELHFRLNGLHRLIQYARFRLRREQKYLILMEREEQRKTVKSYFTGKLETRCASRGFCPRNAQRAAYLVC